MGKTEENIANFLVLLFILFAIIYLLVSLTPLMYLLIALGLVLLVFFVATYLLYKKKQRILPLEILNKLGKFIVASLGGVSSDKKSSKVSGKISPPLSQKQKDKIIIELAKGRCEYPNCSREGNLEVHHIIPRSQGGRNTYDNLIVLCPTHHAMADKGSIPRSRLQYIVRHRKR